MVPSGPGTAAMEYGGGQAEALGSEAPGSEMELACSLEIRSHPSMGSGKATHSTAALEEGAQEYSLTSWEPTEQYPTQVSRQE
jgi:hypothetical protein